MKAKTVLILIVLAGLFGVGAWLVAFRQGSGTAAGNAEPTEAGGDRLVAPAIREKAGAIAGIVVTDGQDSVEIGRDGDGWVVATLGGYPANAETVRRLVTTLSELRIEEPKTTRPELFARLGVEWPPAEEDGQDEYAEPAPVLVRLSGADGGEIAGVVLGRTEYIAGASRQFARLIDSARSVLASARVDAPAVAMKYVDAAFLELPRDSVRRVTITHPTGETVTVVRTSGDGDFGLETVPEGMEPLGEGPANRVGQALAFVNFMDVRPAGETEADADLVGGPVVAVYELFDGTTLTLSVRLDADGAAGGAWVGVVAEDGPGGGEAGAYNSRLGGWSFRLPRAAVESLTRKPTDLMQERASDEAGPALPGDAPELLRAPGDG